MADSKKNSAYSGEIRKEKGNNKTSISSGFLNFEMKTDKSGGKGSVKSEQKKKPGVNGPEIIEKKSSSIEESFNKTSIEGSAAEVVLKDEDNFMGIDTSTEIAGKVLDGSAELSNTINIFEDGEFKGNVDLGVEGEVAFVSGEMKSTIGSDTNNAHMTTEGELISGKASLGITSGKDVTFKNGAGEEITGTGIAVDAGAEGYLAQGSVIAGFSILGIKYDTKITGKMGGAGAKASAGVTTNGLGASVDLGLGVGFGVAISIDTSDAFWKQPDFWEKFKFPWERENHGFIPTPIPIGPGGGGFRGDNSEGNIGINNGGTSNIVLRVTPEELVNQASVIQEQIDRMSREWDNLIRLLSGVQNYWNGEAGDSHMSQFRGFQDDMDMTLRKLKNHPDNLLKMAGVYRETESKAQGVAAALAGDIIV